MAQVVKLLGKCGQRRAEKQLNWNRGTIPKGRHELEGNMACEGAFSARGRKRAEEHLPNLLKDIKAIADEQSQADPTFKTTRLYTRLTAKEVRKQLVLQKGCTDEELPTEETIRVELKELDYQLRNVQKCRPQRKIPETDALFAQLHQLHQEAGELEISDRTYQTRIKISDAEMAALNLTRCPICPQWNYIISPSSGA